MEEVYYDELPQLRKWIRKRGGQDYMELLNIAMAPQSNKEARQMLIAKYLHDIKQAADHLPKPKEKLDREGLSRLRGIIGGKKGR